MTFILKFLHGRICALIMSKHTCMCGRVSVCELRWPTRLEHECNTGNARVNRSLRDSYYILIR